MDSKVLPNKRKHHISFLLEQGKEKSFAFKCLFVVQLAILRFSNEMIFTLHIWLSYYIYKTYYDDKTETEQHKTTIKNQQTLIAE